MKNGNKYIKEKMEDLSFRKAFLEEKTKLDLELLIDELFEDIQSEKPKNVLIKSVKKIKHLIEKA